MRWWPWWPARVVPVQHDDSPPFDGLVFGAVRVPAPASDARVEQWREFLLLVGLKAESRLRADPNDRERWIMRVVTDYCVRWGGC